MQKLTLRHQQRERGQSPNLYNQASFSCLTDNSVEKFVHIRSIYSFVNIRLALIILFLFYSFILVKGPTILPLCSYYSHVWAVSNSARYLVR